MAGLLFQWRDAIMRAPELVASDRHILHVIGFAMDENGRDGYPSISTIVRRTGYTKQTVLDGLAWVKAAGWVRAAGRSRYSTVIYEPTLPTDPWSRDDRAAFMRERQSERKSSKASPARVASLEEARSRRRTTQGGLNGQPLEGTEGRSRSLSLAGLDGDDAGSTPHTTTSPSTSSSTSPGTALRAAPKRPYEHISNEDIVDGIARGRTPGVNWDELLKEARIRKEAA